MRRLYREVAGLPIISPHGHTESAWFADNASLGNAAELLLHPDHDVFRMSLTINSSAVESNALLVDDHGSGMMFVEVAFDDLQVAGIRTEEQVEGIAHQRDGA